MDLQKVPRKIFLEPSCYSCLKGIHDAQEFGLCLPVRILIPIRLMHAKIIAGIPLAILVKRPFTSQPDIELTSLLNEENLH